jgi:hypothetical protein
VSDVPHPDVDWRIFMSYINNNNKSSVNAPVFNSLTGKFSPWIDVVKINSFYGDGANSSASCSIM